MNKFDQIVFKITLALVFLLPLFFLTLTPNFYQWNKTFLLLATVLAFSAVWLVKTFTEKRFSFRFAGFDLAVLLLALVYLASLLLATPNKIEALTNEAGIIFVLTAFYFLLTNFGLDKKNLFFYSLIASAGVLALIAIYQFAGIGAELSPWTWMQSRVWTPAGGILHLLIFLALVLTMAWPLARRAKEDLSRVVLFLTMALISVGLILTVLLVRPGQENEIKLMPFLTGWQISAEAFKFSPFLGTGPASYLTSFNRYKPFEFNTSPSWNLLFTAANNYYFHLLTTVGALGVAAYLFLILRIWQEKKLKGVLGLIFLLQLFLPGNFLQLFVLYLLLGLRAKKGETVSLRLGQRSRWLVILPGLMIVGCGYLGGRAYSAEYYYKKSLDALTANQGMETYNLQIKTINLNPYLDYYHRAYSQVNLALAQSLLIQEKPSDQDRNNAQILIQQAIREAKVAADLNPQSSFNWNNLAGIYRSLINVAEGSGDWTLASLRQAIAFDPRNPLLRVDLGALFYAFGLHDEAVDEFLRAVSLKPDYANGYFNLAFAYQAKEDWQRAALALQNVLNLVEPGSADYEKTKQDLDEVMAKIPPAATPAPAEEQPAEELKEPEPLPSPKITPIELPEEAGPEITPLPEASPTATP